MKGKSDSSTVNTLFDNSKLLQIGIIIVFASAYPVISLVIHLNPSGYVPSSPFRNSLQVSAVMLITFAVLLVIYYLLLAIKDSLRFIILFCLSFIIIEAGTLVSAAMAHKDFFSHLFQVIIVYWLIFFFRNDLFFSSHRQKTFYTGLIWINTIIFAVFSVWLIFMGYAVVTQQEPRWAESIIYNAYNLLLVILLGVSSLRLQLKRFRRLRITDDKLFIDSRDFSGLFNSTEKDLILEFVRTGDSITCADIVKKYSSNDKKTGKNIKWNCGECIDNNFTASQCPKYKKIYNNVLNIKKIFETLEIGTIISPSNKMKIKESGWKLRLFDDVRVIRH